MYVQRKSLVSAVCACTVLLSFTCGVLLDCKRTSLTAYAAPAAPADIILLFYDDMVDNAHSFQNAVLEDIQNGNLDATSDLGKQWVGAGALLLLTENMPAYAPILKAIELGVLPEYLAEHPTTTISASGGFGFYRKSQDGDLIPGYVYACNAGQVVCSSSDINLIIDFNDSTMNANTVPYSSSTSAGFKYTGNTIYHQVRYTDTLGYLSYVGQSYNVFQNNMYTVSWNSLSPPVVTSGTRADYFYLGQGDFYELPTTTIDTSQPWSYYNNVVLPYIHENYPDVTNEYFLFPDGWYPSMIPTDPPEPTSPTGDFILPPYGELMTEPSSWFVTDESGETITNESGEPVTETTMIPVTLASSDNGRYVFRIPTLPNLQAPAETPELSLSLPQKIVGLSAALFRGVYEILNSSGVLTILPFLVAVAVAIYVIYRLGG